jgi:uncharacterized protein
MALTALLNEFDTDRELAGRILVLARERTAITDPSHDWLHVERVTEAARRIARGERADLLVCVTAALLHEVVSLPKDHPEAHRSGEQCALVAGHLLGRLEAPPELIARVSVCIVEHPFSRGIRPSTLESAVLQDADRLDAIGAVGIARAFATSGVLGHPFYAEHDPWCRAREPDHHAWAIDHFYRKLLKIPECLNTPTGRRLAEPRMAIMQAWLQALGEELDGIAGDPGVS